MARQEYYAIAAVGVVALLAIIVLAAQGNTSGAIVGDAAKAQGLSLSVVLSRTAVSTDDAPATASALIDRSTVRAISFIAVHDNGCSAGLGTAVAVPYAVQLSGAMLAQACGVGVYTVYALADHPSGAVSAASEFFTVTRGVQYLDLQLMQPQEDGDPVSGTHQVTFTAFGAVQSVQVRAESAFADDTGVRSVDLIGSAFGRDGYFSFDWDTMSGTAAANYEPYGDRMVLVSAQGTDGSVVSKVVVVRVRALSVS